MAVLTGVMCRKKGTAYRRSEIEGRTPREAASCGDLGDASKKHHQGHQEGTYERSTPTSAAKRGTGAMPQIDTEQFSSALRHRAIILGEEKILIARLAGSEQEKDLIEPVNCEGYGRVRHFRLLQFDDWSPNPLPILPAAKALGRPHSTELRAQVFQNAACNWRCWYCYVDFDRLSANRRVSEYFTADQLISLFLEEPDRPEVIDLSGGQPDLVPEWILWTMQALYRNGLAGKVFLWSDDNLSNRYHWNFLSAADRQFIARYPRYARVGCFKGFDPDSFSFNTRATPELFDEQFGIFASLLAEGYDMYAYVTLTSTPHPAVATQIKSFVDRLQGIHPLLPLRTVPLKVMAFTPTKGRMSPTHTDALAFQHAAHKAWVDELEARFAPADRALPITEIRISS